MARIGKAGKWFFTIVVLLMIIFILIYLFNNKNSSSGTSGNNAVTTVTTTSTYVVKDYDGKVAVFLENRKVPIEIYDTYVNTLPDEDQKLLKTGIPISGDVALEELLEDLTS